MDVRYLEEDRFVRGFRIRPMDAVKLLLEAGADPNIRDEYGYTALNWHVASFRDEGENPLLVRALIQAGADVNIPEQYIGHPSPLHRLCSLRDRC